MPVLRLRLKRQLFHGDKGKDLKLFPVGLSRVLCPKIQGLFDPQRTPGSQLSHLCLTSAGSEDRGLKVKFRLGPFRTQPHKHSVLLRAVQTHLTHGGTGQELGCSPPALPPLPSPGHTAEQTQTGSAEMLWANLHLESLPAASWSLQNPCFNKRKAPAQVSKPTSHTALLL